MNAVSQEADEEYIRKVLKDNLKLMALSGEMQAYCDIEDDMVKGMFGTIVQGYLKKGYNRATAEMMAREFFRYER